MILDSIATVVGIVGGSLGIASFLRRETAEIWLDEEHLDWRYLDGRYIGDQDNPFIRFRVSNVGDSNALRVSISPSHGTAWFTGGITHRGRGISDVPILKPGESFEMAVEAPIEEWSSLQVTFKWTRVPASGPFKRKTRIKNIEGLFGRPGITFYTQDRPPRKFSASNIPALEAQLREAGLEDSIQLHDA